MDELETLRHAKGYLDRLALGIDPISGQELPDDSSLNQVRLARCFFYVSGVLARVIENGGTVGGGAASEPKRPRGKKQPFSATVEQLAGVRVGAPVALSIFIRSVNEAVLAEDGAAENVRRLSYNQVVNGLIAMGFMEAAESAAGRKNRKPTAQGEELGISREQRLNPNGQSYMVNLFNKDAQQFVLDNLDGILSASEGAED